MPWVGHDSGLYLFLRLSVCEQVTVHLDLHQ